MKYVFGSYKGTEIISLVYVNLGYFCIVQVLMCT